MKDIVKQNITIYPSQVLFDRMNHYTDHLGNIRLSYGRDPETNEIAILKESHYYPFACPLRSIRGLQHKGYVGTHRTTGVIGGIGGNNRVGLIPVRNYLDDSYRYTFGGKEEQPELGLNWIDHHARNYMPDLGRWMNVDPLADVAPDWTPYRYGFNNPMRFVDPTGMLEEKKDPPKSVNESNPIQLDEVIVKGSQKESQSKRRRISFNGAMPDYLKHGQPLTWDSPYSSGTLDQYNQDYNTDYTEGNQWNQWYYQNFYKREFDAMIADMHSATHKAAELFMYIMPTPLVGAELLTKAPTLYRSVMKSYRMSNAFRIVKPSALNRTLPGFTDKVSGTTLRQGRGPLLDYATRKPAMQPINNQHFNRVNRVTTGVGLTGLAYYYYYRKTIRK